MEEAKRSTDWQRLADSFHEIEQNIERVLARDRDALIYTVRRSCELKARVVADDERETGVRALLNLGHTFAHALEAAAGYEGLSHGSAVALGLLAALRLSGRPTAAVDEVRSFSPHEQRDDVTMITARRMSWSCR